MRVLKIALISITLGAAGCATTTAEPRVAISTETELAPLLGKRLTINGNFLTINADKTLEGNFGGEKMSGSWEMEEGYWCRTITEASDAVMQRPYDCQKLETNGTEVFGTRDRGNGGSFKYDIE